MILFYKMIQIQRDILNGFTLVLKIQLKTK